MELSRIGLMCEPVTPPYVEPLTPDIYDVNDNSKEVCIMGEALYHYPDTEASSFCRRGDKESLYDSRLSVPVACHSFKMMSDYICNVPTAMPGEACKTFTNTAFDAPSHQEMPQSRLFQEITENHNQLLNLNWTADFKNNSKAYKCDSRTVVCNFVDSLELVSHEDPHRSGLNQKEEIVTNAKKSHCNIEPNCKETVLKQEERCLDSHVLNFESSKHRDSQDCPTTLSGRIDDRYSEDVRFSESSLPTHLQFNSSRLCNDSSFSSKRYEGHRMGGYKSSSNHDRAQAKEERMLPVLSRQHKNRLISDLREIIDSSRFKNPASRENFQSSNHFDREYQSSEFEQYYFDHGYKPETSRHDQEFQKHGGVERSFARCKFSRRSEFYIGDGQHTSYKYFDELQGKKFQEFPRHNHDHHVLQTSKNEITFPDIYPDNILISVQRNFQSGNDSHNSFSQLREGHRKVIIREGKDFSRSRSRSYCSSSRSRDSDYRWLRNQNFGEQIFESSKEKQACDVQRWSHEGDHIEDSDTECRTRVFLSQKLNIEDESLKELEGRRKTLMEACYRSCSPIKSKHWRERNTRKSRDHRQKSSSNSDSGRHRKRRHVSEGDVDEGFKKLKKKKHKRRHHKNEEFCGIKEDGLMLCKKNGDEGFKDSFGIDENSVAVQGLPDANYEPNFEAQVEKLTQVQIDGLPFSHEGPSTENRDDYGNDNDDTLIGNSAVREKKQITKDDDMFIDNGAKIDNSSARGCRCNVVISENDPQDPKDEIIKMNDIPDSTISTYEQWSEGHITENDQMFDASQLSSINNDLNDDNAAHEICDVEETNVIPSKGACDETEVISNLFVAKSSAIISNDMIENVGDLRINSEANRSLEDDCNSEEQDPMQDHLITDDGENSCDGHSKTYADDIEMPADEKIEDNDDGVLEISFSDIYEESIKNSVDEHEGECVESCDNGGDNDCLIDKESDENCAIESISDDASPKALETNVTKNLNELVEAGRNPTFYDNLESISNDPIQSTQTSRLLSENSCSGDEYQDMYSPGDDNVYEDNAISLINDDGSNGTHYAENNGDVDDNNVIDPRYSPTDEPCNRIEDLVPDDDLYSYSPTENDRLLKSQYEGDKKNIFHDENTGAYNPNHIPGLSPAGSDSPQGAYTPSSQPPSVLEDTSPVSPASPAGCATPSGNIGLPDLVQLLLQTLNSQVSSGNSGTNLLGNLNSGSNDLLQQLLARFRSIQKPSLGQASISQNGLMAFSTNPLLSLPFLLQSQKSVSPSILHYLSLQSLSTLNKSSFCELDSLAKSSESAKMSYSPFDVNTVSPRSEDAMSFSPPSLAGVCPEDRCSSSNLNERQSSEDIFKSTGKKRVKAANRVELQQKLVCDIKELLRPVYKRGKIDKEDYKDILRKAVPKILNTNKLSYNRDKITRFTEAYIQKVIATKKYYSKKITNVTLPDDDGSPNSEALPL